jgi:hypothetical protein
MYHICPGTHHLILHPNGGEERNTPRETHGPERFETLVKLLSKPIETETKKYMFVLGTRN